MQQHEHGRLSGTDMGLNSLKGGLKEPPIEDSEYCETVSLTCISALTANHRYSCLPNQLYQKHLPANKHLSSHAATPPLHHSAVNILCQSTKCSIANAHPERACEEAHSKPPQAQVTTHQSGLHMASRPSSTAQIEAPDSNHPSPKS